MIHSSTLMTSRCRHQRGQIDRRALLLGLGAAALLIIAGLLTMLLLSPAEKTGTRQLDLADKTPQEPASTASTQHTVASQPGLPQPELEPAIPQPPLPALNDSDEEVRATLGDLLPSQFDRTRRSDQLLRRMAVLTGNFGRGKLLRDKLPLPAAGGTLAVEERGERIFLAEENYSRYDALADTVDGLDADALARWFTRYEPLFDEAMRELGGNEEARGMLIAGIDLMLATPRVDRDIELVQPGVFYRFADPQLEALPDGAKLMIRIGPRNAGILRNKLTRLRQALANPTRAGQR